MLEEYRNYLLDAASFSNECGETFKGIQFDEKEQAVEVFVLQALSMTSSHCRAAALLLQNDFFGEAASVLRSVQELLFDLRWMLEVKDRQERLERAYKLEADPYAHWDKETKIVSKQMSPERGSIMRGPLDEIATKYTFLTKANPDSSVSFKSAPDFAGRMGNLRPKYYHIYCYSSLFTHPSPFIKSLYLKTSNSTSNELDKIEESHMQFIAYTLLFVEFIIGFAEETLGAFAPATKGQRDALYNKMAELVKKANKKYFHNPEDDNQQKQSPA